MKFTASKGKKRAAPEAAAVEPAPRDAKRVAAKKSRLNPGGDSTDKGPDKYCHFCQVPLPHPCTSHPLGLDAAPGWAARAGTRPHGCLKSDSGPGNSGRLIAFVGHRRGHDNAPISLVAVSRVTQGLPLPGRSVQGVRACRACRVVCLQGTDHVINFDIPSQHAKQVMMACSTPGCNHRYCVYCLDLHLGEQCTVQSKTWLCPTCVGK